MAEVLAYFFLLLFLLTLTGLIFVSVVAVRYANTITKMENRIEQALDVLDKHYSEIGGILHKPVFYDSPEIKRVVNSLRHSQQALLWVANNITTLDEIAEEPDADRQ